MLARASPRERRALLQRRIAVMAHRASCGALDALMAKVVRSTPERQCPRLARALPALVTRCACRMDWQRLLTMTRLFFGPYRFVGSWTGRLSPTRGTTKPPRQQLLSVSRHARWVDVVGRLVELPGSEFWIEPI